MSDKDYVRTLERCLKTERKNNEYLLEKVTILEQQVKELKERLQENRQ
jgi:cell division protein FtsB